MKFLLALLLQVALVATCQSRPPRVAVNPHSDTNVETGDITTHGDCSPVLVEPKDGITIKCSATGLSKNEIAKQRQQYAAILNTVRASGLKEDQILELVQQIAKGVRQISQTTRRRSLTSEQHEALISKLKVIADTSLLIDVQAGEDDRVYAQDFIDLFTKDLSWKSAHAGFGLEEVATTGVFFVISREDNDAHTVPDGCVIAGKTLSDLGLVDQILALGKGQDVAPPRGTCTLYISRRKIPVTQ